MNLAAIGISHHTAPVEIREQMWLSETEVRAALGQLHDRHRAECVLLSTCNRTELYALLPDGKTAEELSLPGVLMELKRAPASVRPEHFRLMTGEGAVRQLFAVASGIDSLVLGDIQILSQVKESYQLARDAGGLGPVLNRLMQSALHVGKRVRTETHLVEGAVSVSYAAVELAGKIFADLATKSALLVGAGETGELTLKHLVGKGIGSVRVANRTREKAEALVASLGGSVTEYGEIENALREVDIAIISVTSPEYVLGLELVRSAIRRRSNRPLILIDIGVPRNVDPAVRKIENIFLYDMDSLHTVVDRNLERRRAELPLVNGIIQEEVGGFFSWLDSLQAGPTIQQLRDAFEVIRREEVGKQIHRFAPEDRELVELVTKRILNKILHQPMTALKTGAGEETGQKEMLHRIATLRTLFGIGHHPPEHNDKT